MAFGWKIPIALYTSGALIARVFLIVGYFLLSCYPCHVYATSDPTIDRESNALSQGVRGRRGKHGNTNKRQRDRRHEVFHMSPLENRHLSNKDFVRTVTAYTSYPLGHPTTSPTTVQPSRPYGCYDSTIKFKWFNDLPVDCEWVVKNANIACSEVIAMTQCPRSCGTCYTSSLTRAPSILSKKPSQMPHPLSMSMSMSYGA